MSIVGEAQPRIDGAAKVSGKARYAADVPAQNLAHGVVICSTIAKGRIASVDTTVAAAAPGVLQIVTYKNCPKFPVA